MQNSFEYYWDVVRYLQGFREKFREGGYANLTAQSFSAIEGVWDSVITELERQPEGGRELGRALRLVANDIRKEVGMGAEPTPSEPSPNYPQQPAPSPNYPQRPEELGPNYPNYPNFEQRQRQIYSARDRIQLPRQAQPSTPRYPIRETRREGRPSIYGRYSRFGR